MTAITLEFTPSPDDFAEGLRLFTRHSRQARTFDFLSRLFLITWFMASLMVSAWYFSRGDLFFGAVTLATAVFLATVFFYRFVGLPKKQYEHYVKVQPRTSAVVTDAGIELKTPSAENSAPWSLFTGLAEGERVFLLLVQGGRFFILPKSAFANPADLEAFRALAAEKLPQA